MIACLGWGSLIWNPGALPIRNGWFQDGPCLEVEFVRQSSDDRLTLVINPGSAKVRSLWTIMDSNDLDSAAAALCKREGICDKNCDRFIGRWSLVDESDPKNIPGLSAWAHCRGIEHVIWTALPPKFNVLDKDKAPSEEQAVCHLKSLRGQARKNAEEYIRKAPVQIDTIYRKRFESEFGWTPIS